MTFFLLPVTAIKEGGLGEGGEGGLGGRGGEGGETRESLLVHAPHSSQQRQPMVQGGACVTI